MSYATGSDMTARYDSRKLGDYVSDTGTRVADPTSDPHLQAALDDASGIIDAACLRGGRYLPTDLSGMTGNGKNLLIRLNCDLAWGLILQRRDLAIPKQVETAYGLLERLAEGTMIFGDVQAAIDSGKPVNVRLDFNVSLVSSLDRVFGDLLIDPRNQSVSN